MRISCVCGIDSWSEVEHRAHAGCQAKADRRQAAREAFWDASTGLMTGAGDGIAAAIETATRVRVTPEILAAARGAYLRAQGSWTVDPGPRETARLEAAFRAAGFEVEQ